MVNWQCLVGLVLMQGIRSWVLTAVYASNNNDEQIEFWNILKRVYSQDIPDRIIGDYNVISTEGEKKSGYFLVNGKVRDFNHSLRRLNCVILDLLELSILGVTTGMDL